MLKDKVLLYSQHKQFAIYVLINGVTYKHALDIGFKQINANELKQLDVPCKWNVE